MGSVNRLNPTLVEHIQYFYDVGTHNILLRILHGAYTGMYNIDSHALQTIQLFLNPLIFQRIFTAAITVEECYKRYIF